MPSNLSVKPYAIGLAVTLVVVAGGWLATHVGSAPSGQRNDAYAAQVTIGNSRVSAAETMMAGGLVYYDATLVNNGDRTLTAVTVALTFNDLYGKPLETDQRVLLDDHVRPIRPHSQRAVEIGFDRVPAGWNQAPPAAIPVAVYVR